MDQQRTKPKIHPLSIVAAIGFALLLIGVAYLVFRAQAGRAQPAQTTPQFQVTLLPAPTETPTLESTSLLVTPTPADVSILPPDVVAVGRYVKVVGTQGLGLRMRAEAGTSGEVNFLAMDDEAFRIIGGPITKDGYTWWQCEALLDKTRSGWAAEDFMQVLELSTPQP
ncbi:MAG: hypothetical protein PHW11_09415 [Anaerolineaceae bacterium]|jgi:hypothetical protein|nr:hypothetical protein [Anaerolineaceae bacterium]MDD4043011.1 hypothetical protein [Anaerolineaceae bacterium]MDD4578274.1 hypothetical protein [Anaerolineaceae bacterium]